MVTTREMLAAGISEDRIAWRARSGYLVRQHAGVYFVGHRPRTVAARYMAAVKACGERSQLWGMAAGWLWELLPRWWEPPPPELVVPTQRRVSGVLVHRRRRMDQRDGTRRHGIPVATVPVALIVMASRLPFDELGKAVHEADVRHRVGGDQIERALERHPTAKGRARLLAIARGDAPIVLSRLERRFLRLLRAHGFPLPLTNRPSGAGYVDCRWPGLRLTVELDSYRFHRSRHAWEKDHAREREARARGDEFRRYTWRDVVEEPAPTVSDLARLIDRPG